MESSFWIGLLTIVLAVVPLSFYLEKKRAEQERLAAEKKKQRQLAEEDRKKREEEQRKLQQEKEEQQRVQQEQERLKRQRDQKYQELIYYWKLRMIRDHIPYESKRYFDLDIISPDYKPVSLDQPIYDYPLYWRTNEVLEAAVQLMDVCTVRAYLEAGGDQNAKADQYFKISMFENLCQNWIIDSSWGNRFHKMVSLDVVHPLPDDENDNSISQPEKAGAKISIDCPENITGKECMIIAKMLLLSGAQVTQVALEKANTPRFKDPKTPLLELIQNGFPNEEDKKMVRKSSEMVEPPPELVRKFKRHSPDYLQMTERKIILPSLLIPKKYGKDLQRRTIDPPFGKTYLRPSELMQKAIYFADVVLVRHLLESKLSPNIYVENRFEMMTPLEFLAIEFLETMCSMNLDFNDQHYFRHSEPEDRLLIALLLLLAGAEITPKCLEAATQEDQWHGKKTELLNVLNTWKESEGRSEEERIQKVMKIIFPSSSPWGTDTALAV